MDGISVGLLYNCTMVLENVLGYNLLGLLICQTSQFAMNAHNRTHLNSAISGAVVRLYDGTTERMQMTWALHYY